MFTFDLNNGYHHIEDATDHRCHHGGFSWVDSVSMRAQFYLFMVLSFGVCSAPDFFTEVLKPLVKHWRLNGARIALFLDDAWHGV